MNNLLSDYRHTGNHTFVCQMCSFDYPKAKEPKSKTIIIHEGVKKILETLTRWQELIKNYQEQLIKRNKVQKALGDGEDGNGKNGCWARWKRSVQVDPNHFDLNPIYQFVRRFQEFIPCGEDQKKPNAIKCELRLLNTLNAQKSNLFEMIPAVLQQLDALFKMYVTELGSINLSYAANLYALAATNPNFPVNLDVNEEGIGRFLWLNKEAFKQTEILEELKPASLMQAVGKIPPSVTIKILIPYLLPAYVFMEKRGQIPMLIGFSLHSTACDQGNGKLESYSINSVMDNRELEM